MIDVIADRLPELGTVEVFLPPASSRDRRASAPGAAGSAGEWLCFAKAGKVSRES